MSNSSVDVRDLIETTRINGAVYSDPAIYQAEIEKIWYGNWVYIGHESEVPNPGDFYRKKLVDQQLILSRDKEGEVHVLYNRCSHRSALVCRETKGNAKRFVCPFHGWSFNPDGQLVGITNPDGYGERLKEVRNRLDLPRVEHVAIHAGFIFCSLNPPTQTFEEYIGPAKFALDKLVGLSPDGKIKLTAGWMRQLKLCNWKVSVESLLDHYHPTITHASMLQATGETVKNIGAEGLRGLGGGHCSLGFSARNVVEGVPLKWLGDAKPEKFTRYIDALKQTYGEEETERKLIEGAEHIQIFPNLVIARLNVIVVQPLGPDQSTEETSPVQFEGQPEFNRRVLRQCEGAMGPAGLIVADDGEMGERTQMAIDTLQPAWLELSRGVEREVRQGEATFSPNETDETTHREFFRHYLSVMAS